MKAARLLLDADADREALHTLTTGWAVRLGPPPAAESYLKVEALLRAARAFKGPREKAGQIHYPPQAVAIHPGKLPHALLVHQNGKLKMITYWCDVCSIRAYAPGPCVCCQKETTLELRDPDDIQ